MTIITMNYMNVLNACIIRSPFVKASERKICLLVFKKLTRVGT